MPPPHRQTSFPGNRGSTSSSHSLGEGSLPRPNLGAGLAIVPPQVDLSAAQHCGAPTLSAGMAGCSLSSTRGTPCRQGSGKFSAPADPHLSLCPLDGDPGACKSPPTPTLLRERRPGGAVHRCVNGVLDIPQPPSRPPLRRSAGREVGPVKPSPAILDRHSQAWPVGRHSRPARPGRQPWPNAVDKSARAQVGIGCCAAGRAQGGIPAARG